MTLTLWHNPRCSKSRQTLALLRDRGRDPEIRRYLDAPPDREELETLLALLGLPAIALVRTKEKRWRELGLGPDTPPAALIAAMAADPILIERPVLIAGNRAAIGRPPEAVLDIL